MSFALCLDLDGTLADSLHVMRAVYARFVRDVGGQPSDSEFARLNGPPLGTVVEQLKKSHGLALPLAELMAHYNELLDETYHTVSPQPAARELVARARERGWLTGVVTSNDSVRVRAWLERVGLAPLVSFAVCGDDVERGKPDPEPYLRALSIAGCAASASLAIEDSVLGAQAARAAHIPTLGLDWAGTGLAWPAGVVSIRSLAAASDYLERAVRMDG